MDNHISFGGRRNDATFYDNAPATRDLVPTESYVLRVIMRRARIGLPHALLVAELAGILREGA